MAPQQVILIPKAYQVTIVTVQKGVYDVYWVGFIIATQLKRRQAHILRRDLNRFLFRLQLAEPLWVSAFYSAFGEYLTAAANSSMGFMPVMQQTVTPPIPPLPWPQ